MHPAVFSACGRRRKGMPANVFIQALRDKKRRTKAGVYKTVQPQQLSLPWPFLHSFLLCDSMKPNRPINRLFVLCVFRFHKAVVLQYKLGKRRNPLSLLSVKAVTGRGQTAKNTKEVPRQRKIVLTLKTTPQGDLPCGITYIGTNKLSRYSVTTFSRQSQQYS